MTAAPQQREYPHEAQHAVGDRSDGRQASMGELAAQLSDQVARLVRDEMALAQVEAKQRAKRIGAGVGMFGFAGLVALFGACCFVAAAVLGLCNVLRPWFAALVVGAALVLLGGFVALPGWKGITDRRPPVGHDAVESVKADVAAVKQAMKR